MYILKNALTNIKRNPVRNLLVGIELVLTIISSLSACVAILKFSPITILKERTYDKIWFWKLKIYRISIKMAIVMF